MQPMTPLWQAAEATSAKLRVYAQRQRLMILIQLLDGARSVQQLDDATHIGQPALSQQLAMLRTANLVDARREAKHVYYSLANDEVRVCVKQIETMFFTMA
ncbi:MAG: metalloregulator ArsR/SmtB family transcription factor [Acidocella sp.]|nr:metalloregulator ArsR/SmtB family transcription factor [Acidocella sp.]